MTETVRQICTRAARKTGDSSEGQKAPVAYDMDVLKSALLSWYVSAIDAGTFGELTDVAVTEDYTAKENERIADISGSSVVITLPATIDDPTICPRLRAPHDLSVVSIAGGHTFLYDIALGQWVDLDALTLDSVAPLSARNPDGLASVVAVLMMEERGMEPGQLTLSRAARFRLALAARHNVPRRAVATTYY